MTEPLRQHARAIWQAAVDAANPFELARDAVARLDLGSARRIVVGGGKAGAGMAAGVEAGLADRLDAVEGVINVPEGAERPLRKVRLVAARPAGSNHPTEAGVRGVEEQLALLATLGPSDAVLCLLSGGGSALLPAPVAGVSLEDKQAVTRLLHACGASIDEMNCVRKHLSRVKGGRLAQAVAARGCPLDSLIISDVIGDPLDVIASGPTAPDPTTFADALAVLDRFGLRGRTPAAVLAHLERGAEGAVEETPRSLPAGVRNHVLGNNARALTAAAVRAEALGYRVLNFGSFLAGETRPLGVVLAGLVRSVRADGVPLPPPACLLSGGETTVTLGPEPGRGGRNQELVLAALVELGTRGMKNVVVLSGGTDGEDGPTDAAGAVADEGTLGRAEGAEEHLVRHDAYPFFEAAGDLLKTGLTQTNVMDVRVILIGS
jgi:hydroxypyruvate reductase/glycerate 2-kinase